MTKERLRKIEKLRRVEYNGYSGPYTITIKHGLFQSTIHIVTLENILLAHTIWMEQSVLKKKSENSFLFSYFSDVTRADCILLYKS